MVSPFPDSSNEQLALSTQAQMQRIAESQFLG
jgi:hypothetical protein